MVILIKFVEDRIGGTMKITITHNSNLRTKWDVWKSDRGGLIVVTILNTMIAIVY